MPFPIRSTATAAKPKVFVIPENCPNASFAQWLNEWYCDCATRQSKLQFAYKRALESMLKWPERLRSGRDATKLPGIGPSIAAKLQERMVREGGRVAREEEIEILDLHEDEDDSGKEQEEEGEAQKKPKKKSNTNSTAKKVKAYIPAFRSAPYSVLIALLLAGGALNKSEISLRAQPFATSSLTDGLFPALNGALKTLESKGFIGRVSGSLALTQKGAELAQKLWQSGEQQNQQQPAPTLDPSKLLQDSETAADAPNEPSLPMSEALHEFWWPQDSFEIVCCVDVREIRSRDDRCYLSDRLTQMGVANEVRNLELGDFLWIARRKKKKQNSELTESQDHLLQANHPTNLLQIESEELVLPVIIERKREDDLCASITDGRFKEQKHRLRSCLISRPIYLVERPQGSSASGSAVFDAERLMGAALQCQISDGLQYRQTAGLEESIAFVSAVHRRLKAEFEGKRLRGCFIQAQHFEFASFRTAFNVLSRTSPAPLHFSYSAFALLNAKTGNQTPTDLLCKQLLCLPGLTFPKARHLLGKADFCSPQAINRFYEERVGFGGCDALKNEVEGGKKFGAALSRRIYEVFGE